MKDEMLLSPISSNCVLKMLKWWRWLVWCNDFGDRRVWSPSGFNIRQRNPALRLIILTQILQNTIYIQK